MQSDPIVYRSGQFKISQQFVDTKEFRDVRRSVGGDQDMLRSVMAYLYFMHSPESNYRNLPTDKRLAALHSAGRVPSDKKFMDMLRTRSVKALEDLFILLATTPSERMRTSLIDAIEVFLHGVTGTGKTGADLVQAVKEADQLFEAMNKLERMAHAERGRMVKGQYKPRMFEHKDNIS